MSPERLRLELRSEGLVIHRHSARPQTEPTCLGNLPGAVQGGRRRLFCALMGVPRPCGEPLCRHQTDWAACRRKSWLGVAPIQLVQLLDWQRPMLGPVSSRGDQQSGGGAVTVVTGTDSAKHGQFALQQRLRETCFFDPSCRPHTNAYKLRATAEEGKRIGQQPDSKSGAAKAVVGSNPMPSA